MCSVTLNTYANLRQYTAGQPSIDLEIRAGTTIRQLLEQLKIPEQEVKILLVDHRPSTPEQTLSGGENVDLFSAIGGG